MRSGNATDLRGPSFVGVSGRRSTVLHQSQTPLMNDASFLPIRLADQFVPATNERTTNGLLNRWLILCYIRWIRDIAVRPLGRCSDLLIDRVPFRFYPGSFGRIDIRIAIIRSDHFIGVLFDLCSLIQISDRIGVKGGLVRVLIGHKFRKAM